MLLTYILLGLSICAVWAPRLSIALGLRLQLWMILFAGAIVSGFYFAILTWPALIALGLLIGASFWSQRARMRAAQVTLSSIAVFVAFALALHIVPGFHNPVVLENARLSDDAAAFTQYANFDKGAAGLVLLAVYSQRVESIDDARRIILPALVAAAGTAAAVLACAVGVGYVRWDPKLSTYALTFLVINLLFTCVAEETFFRGLIQERFMRALKPSWHWIAIATVTVLFGLAHIRGGLTFVVLAMIAGLGYSLAYAVTRRVEAAIFTHFGVNAVHFVGFTYPHLAT